MGSDVTYSKDSSQSDRRSNISTEVVFWIRLHIRRLSKSCTDLLIWSLFLT